MRRRSRIWRSSFLAVGALMALAAAGGLREDEIACEEAVVRLLDCCPSLDPKVIECDYSTGCDSTAYPSLPVHESECIQDRDCDAIVSASICERALNLEPRILDLDGGAVTLDGSPAPARAPVCP